MIPCVGGVVPGRKRSSLPRGTSPMPPVYEITFFPSGDVCEFFGSRGDYYELEDGSHLDVWSKLVWCRRCGDFTEGESIEALEEIDRHLDELGDPTSELYHFTRDAHFRSLFAEQLRRRRRWRMGRQHPPKCLECGSTAIIVLPLGERVRDPNGPGWIEVTITGHCSTQFNNRFYTPEGDRIPRDTEPTYWMWTGEPRSC